MIISKFDINPCPKNTQIIRELIRTRRLKQIMNNVQKPAPIPIPQQIQQPQPPAAPFTIQKQINIKKEIRKKIFKKNSSRRIVKQFKLMNKYNVFLLHYLNKTARLEYIRNSPILMSVLDTRNEPDYPFNYEEEAYRKEYPHYSNIIELTKIPVEEKAPVFIVPTKMTEPFRNIYATTCVTISQIKRFCVRYLECDEITFEKTAERLMMPDRNVKLMYEVVDHVFELEKLGERLGRSKNKAVTLQKITKRIKEVINLAFKDKVSSQYIPRSQIRVSLAQLHTRLNSMQIDLV